MVKNELTQNDFWIRANRLVVNFSETNYM